MFKKSVYFTVVWGLSCLVGTAGALGEKGEILFEYWDGIGSTLDNLYNSDKWPDQPDTWEYRTSLEGKTDWADTYSTRVQPINPWQDTAMKHQSTPQLAPVPT